MLVLVKPHHIGTTYRQRLVGDSIVKFLSISEQLAAGKFEVVCLAKQRGEREHQGKGTEH